MKFEEHRQFYLAEKAKAIANLEIVEAEVTQLRETVLRLEGGIVAVNDLEKAEMEELEKKAAEAEAEAKAEAEAEAEADARIRAKAQRAPKK